MVKALAQDVVGLLDQSEVAFVEGVLFGPLTRIQGNLFTVVYQPRVLEAVLALQPLLGGRVFSELGC